MNQTIARYLKPDYLILQSEPGTDAEQLPGNMGNPLKDPVKDANIIAGFLHDLQVAGLRTTNMIVGAGFGTDQAHFDAFLTNFVNLSGLDLLDVHVYAVNYRTNNGVTEDYLERLLQMADAAHAHGMRIGMGECWLFKEGNSEYGSNLGGDTFRGRNVYSFWAPLDREFLLCMVKASYWKQLDFLDPYWADCFFSYLDYFQMQTTVRAMTNSGSTLDQVGQFLDRRNFHAVSSQFPMLQPTDCGRGYAEYIQSGPPILRITKSSVSTITINWSPVAIRFLLEEKPGWAAHSDWSSVMIPPREAGSDTAVLLTTPKAKNFYRLHQP